MNKTRHDLVTIVNPKLQSLEPEAVAAEHTAGNVETLLIDHEPLKQQARRAIVLLNTLRYLLAFGLLTLIVTDYYPQLFKVPSELYNSWVLTACGLIMLGSAILFTYASQRLAASLNTVIAVQVLLDVAIVTVLAYFQNGVTSGLFILYFLVVSTASVVLDRINAVATAALAILMMFAERFITYLSTASTAELNLLEDLPNIAFYGTVLLVSAFLVSNLARAVRAKNLEGFVPGRDTLESFLVNEEIKAIKAALASTGGNKTKAAQLLGMSFRSFRYKTTKYKID